MNKFLIISSEFPPLPGGIGNHALCLAKELHKNGKKITVITNQREKNNDDEINFDEKLPFKVKRIYRNKISLITYFSRTYQSLLFIKSNKDFATICSGKFSLWVGGLSSVFFKRNYFAVVHGSEIKAGGKISKFITKWSLTRFKKIIAVSHFTKDLVLDVNKNLDVVVINNGFELKPEQNNHFQIIGNPSIVTVGNVTFRKGQQNVINALPLLTKKYPEIIYNIVGIPTEKEKFIQFAKQNKVEDKIKFLGILENANLNSVLMQSKVFFMLSDNLKNGDVEGFGIAVLEANALGLPAIGSINSGIADAIKDGFSGKLVNPHNPEEILLAFEEIMNNYEFYSKNAISWSKNFNWNEVVKKYLTVLENEK